MWIDFVRSLSKVYLAIPFFLPLKTNNLLDSSLRGFANAVYPVSRPLYLNIKACNSDVIFIIKCNLVI